MAQDKPDFSALVGSRICHDLISPIGAIGNGMELLVMSGGGGSPEFELINSSVSNANARIRFFRIAFGHSEATQPVDITEVCDILSALSVGARVQFCCHHGSDIARNELRAIFLAMMCVENALPYGGEVTLRNVQDRWLIAAEQASGNAEKWANLTGGGASDAISPGQVEFALLPQAVADLGRELQVSKPEGALAIKF